MPETSTPTDDATRNQSGVSLIQAKRDWDAELDPDALAAFRELPHELRREWLLAVLRWPPHSHATPTFAMVFLSGMFRNGQLDTKPDWQEHAGQRHQLGFSPMLFLLLNVTAQNLARQQLDAHEKDPNTPSPKKALKRAGFEQGRIGYRAGHLRPGDWRAIPKAYENGDFANAVGHWLTKAGETPSGCATCVARKLERRAFRDEGPRRRRQAARPEPRAPEPEAQHADFGRPAPLEATAPFAVNIVRWFLEKGPRASSRSPAGLKTTAPDLKSSEEPAETPLSRVVA